VDAEVLALRRSKAFLLQHLTAYALLMLPIYTVLLSITALLVSFSGKLVPVAAMRMVLVPVAAAILFIFSDNLLRAAAALMAMDEQVRVRRFLSFRVFWKLVKTVPVLAVTQTRSLLFFGPGWVIGDSLWPVLCVVEKLSGKAAVQRSRDLMTGLRSAGRALAIRHLALAAFAIAEVIKSECGYHCILVSCVRAFCRGSAVSVRPDGRQREWSVAAVRPYAGGANDRASVLRQLNDLVGGWGDRLDVSADQAMAVRRALRALWRSWKATVTWATWLRRR
jgi:hypothetical protein